MVKNMGSDPRLTTITAAEFEQMVQELLDLEDKMIRLGSVQVMTSQGPYTMSERLMSDDIPEQRAYNEARMTYRQKKRIVDAFALVAAFKRAASSTDSPT